MHAYKGRSLPDIIVPLPLHWKKLLWRGFNQSYIVANHLATQLAIPLKDNLCKRTRYSKPQHLLSRTQRNRILRDSFFARPSSKGLHIALVDDVVTTTATARAASRAMLDAGAKSVDIWCIARTALD